MKKLVAALLVFVLLLGFFAYKQQQRPVSNVCGVAIGGDTVAGKGVEIARSIGQTIHDIAHNPPPTTKDIQDTIQGVFHDVFWYWIKSFVLSSRGQKMDPQIIRMQQRAQQAQQAAQDACEPCPAGTADDNGGDSNDPNLQIGPKDRSLTGDKLATAALKAAGFPADQIPMGVQVAKLESGYNPKAVNPAAGGNWGMWQINSVHRTLLNRYDWRDPYDSAQMAYLIWKDAGNSWSRWSTAASARDQIGTTAAASAGNSDNGAPGGSAKVCQTTSDTPDIAQGSGTVTTADFNAFRNPRNADQAVAWLMQMAQNKTPIRTGACLHYMAAAYGHYSTTPVNGRFYAKDQYYAAPANLKHPGDTRPPKGALMYWDTGTGKAGHIAMSLGDGRVISTDAPTRGRIGVVPYSYFRGYGTYLGWLPPSFIGKTKIAA